MVISDISILPNRQSEPLKVAVCCVTRRRPKLLGQTLSSLEQLSIPTLLTPIFIIVENDNAKHSEYFVNIFTDQVGENNLIYELEPEIGIPFARNKAIELAVEAKADIALFLDDDETATEDWLEKLVEKYRNSNLMLIGGPVRARHESSLSSYWERIIQNGVAARYARVEKKARQKFNAGREKDIAIVTNNWLADLGLFTVYNLAFDIKLRHTGGSDTALWREVRRLKLPTGWAVDAIVYETVPSTRSSIWYQFKRGMEQSKTSLRAKSQNVSTSNFYIITIFMILVRSVILLASIVLLPFSFSSGIIRFVRSAGWIAGRVLGLFGSRSKLYKE